MHLLAWLHRFVRIFLRERFSIVNCTGDRRYSQNTASNIIIVLVMIIQNKATAQDRHLLAPAYSLKVTPILGS